LEQALLSIITTAIFPFNQPTLLTLSGNTLLLLRYYLIYIFTLNEEAEGKVLEMIELKSKVLIIHTCPLTKVDSPNSLILFYFL